MSTPFVLEKSVRTFQSLLLLVKRRKGEKTRFNTQIFSTSPAESDRHNHENRKIGHAARGLRSYRRRNEDV